MIGKPTIAKSAVQHTATIHLIIPGMEMPKHVEPAINEIMQVLTEQGVQPSGPMFSYHRRMPSDTFDFEIGFPVSRPIAGKGRVKASEIPAATVLRTTYQGPYEGLAQGWMAFEKEVIASGHNAANWFWESYAAGPESGSDPRKWRTELNRPLIG